MIARVACLAICLTATVPAYADLSELEAHGRQIYHEGRAAASDSDPITALLGVDDMELPASAVPCASCHGANGRGRPEGGVVPSDVTWSELTKRYGHEHDYGRRHPAYDEASAAAAIATGIDPAGNRMDVIMPRYRLAAADMDALIAYLKRLEFELDPGVSEDRVRIATLLPVSGQAAALGAAVKAALQAFVNQLNAGGGVNGRSIDLLTLPLGTNPPETVANVEKAIAADGIFAFVAVFDQGAERQLADVFDTANMPVIGVLPAAGRDDGHTARHSFYVYTGKAELARALSNFAAEPGSESPRRQLVIGPEGGQLSALARALARKADRSVETAAYTAGKFDARVTAELVRDEDDLLFLGSAAEFEGLLGAIYESGRKPRLFLVPGAVTPSIMRAPAEFDGRIFVAYPTMPADVTEDGQEFYESLAGFGEMSQAHMASQVSALASARVLIEAMRRAGRSLSREALVAELQKMNDFSTGLSPPVTFSLNRRIGALGAYVLMVDLGAGTMVPVGSWRQLEQ